MTQELRFPTKLARAQEDELKKMQERLEKLESIYNERTSSENR